MARRNPRQHIKIDGFTNTLDYRYPKQVNLQAAALIFRNRAQHGNRILSQLNVVRQQFGSAPDQPLPEQAQVDEIIYTDFTSAWGYQLDFNALDSDKANADFQVVNIREETRPQGEDIQYRYHATLVLTTGGITSFIRKINHYLNRNIIYRGQDTGNARYYKLFTNIESIQQATLRSFWVDEPEYPFPEGDQNVWWEAWFRKTANNDQHIERVLTNLNEFGVQIGQTKLEFAEHVVRLLKGTPNQLAQSLLLLDNLAELRKPQETADFVCHRSANQQQDTEWVEDLINRTAESPDERSVFVCILDSGANNSHPLLTQHLPEARMYSWKREDWGVSDDWPNGGHGTGVAALALYGDLVEALSERGNIRILHGIESFKILNSRQANDPDLYGAIVEYATSAPYVDFPDALRVFCLTITDQNFSFHGRPSAWSAALDKIAFGTTYFPTAPQLIIASAGNVSLSRHDEYPSTNELTSVHDPAQAYNAITVGSYTRKDHIDPATGLIHLAPHGGMSPSNSTSILWEHQWPLKPDIVMEGGNSSTDGVNVSDHHSLKLLSIDSEYPRYTFMPFGDTSAAAGLAAKMAAQLRNSYPLLWPETIRGLIIHSAEWTTSMLGNRPFSELNEAGRKALLRTVGYGVPILENALYSAQNSLTLIAEREIQPYQLIGSLAKSKEYHLYDLPWPIDVLSNDIYDQDVTLKVTLSYFIEPNPGSRNKRYANNFQYYSHNLDFAVIKPRESLEIFQRRISAAFELPDDQIDNTEEPWSIRRVRSRGSVKKDFITMSGADMALRNKIAVYPKPGWYRSRLKLKKTDTVVRYSLIVTLETDNVEIDLLTPVLNLIPIPS